MTTENKTAANLANAQLSTGPRTDAGKAISSRNALKHGLTAKTVLLPDEDAVEYQNFSAGMLKGLDPINAVEEALAVELIDIQWRLLRVSRFEARFMAPDSPDMKSLNSISLHAARMKRQYSASLQEFQQMHAANRRTLEAQLKQGELIYEADNLLGRESTLDQHGFDFTVKELEGWMNRKLACDEAEEAIDNFEPESANEDDEDLDGDLDDDLDDAA
jgi:hypothetical protein